MKDLGMDILESLLGEYGEPSIYSPGGTDDAVYGAGIGAGIGGGIGAYRWYKERQKLSRELAQCNGDVACAERVRARMDALKMSSIKKIGGGLVTGGAVGALAGGVNQFAKGVAYHDYAGKNRVGTADLLRHAAGDAALQAKDDLTGSNDVMDGAVSHFYDTGRGRSWKDVLPR